MRRLLLVAVMCGAVSGAQAADMPDLPFLRGSFTEGLSSAKVNWQGFYVGGQAAYGTADMNFTRSGQDRSQRSSINVDRRRQFNNLAVAAAGKAHMQDQRLWRIRRLQFAMGRRRPRLRAELHPRQFRRFADRQQCSRFFTLPSDYHATADRISNALDEYLRLWARCGSAAATPSASSCLICLPASRWGRPISIAPPRDLLSVHRSHPAAAPGFQTRHSSQTRPTPATAI